MGKIEEKNRKRRKRADLQKILLNAVAIAGVVSVGVLAPNVLGAMAKLGILPTGRAVDSIRAARKRLVAQGYLRYEGTKLRLTQKGEARLRSLQLRGYQIERPKRWDNRWRVLIFDIPEKRKGLRDKIRRTLIAAGFVRLQDSVWLFPYDCEELVTLLKADFKIGKDMLYMIVDTLEYDKPFLEEFKLSR